MTTNTKEYNKEWRKNNPKYKEKVKLYLLKNKERIREYHKRYCKKNKEQKKEYDKKYNQKPEVKEKSKKRAEVYRQKYPEKIKARKKARQIKISINQTCQICNERLATEKHHYNYSKPLGVKFLCCECHKKMHKCEVKNV